MIPLLFSLTLLECQSYQLGKHVCSSYSNRLNKRVNVPFDLIHSDIWVLIESSLNRDSPILSHSVMIILVVLDFT